MKVGTAFCDYENYHAFSVLKGLDNIKKYHFLDTPPWRKGKNWESGESQKLRFFSISALKQIIKSDYVIFWGVFSPFPAMILYFILSAVAGKDVIICSEGFKNKKRGLSKRLISIFMLFVKQNNMSVLCIGKDANADYKSIGFTNVSYYKFGFFEEYNNTEHIDIAHKYSDLDIRPLRLLFVGQLIERKGILEFLTKLKDVERSIIIDVAGDGKLRGDINSLLSSLPSNVSVVLHGHCDTDKLSCLYSSADVFLLPSKYEGWGVVVNQAIHYKLPLLLASNVRSGEGFLFDNNGAVFIDYSQALSFISSIDAGLISKMANHSGALSAVWNINVARTRLSEFINNGSTYDSGPLSDYSV
ncbi:glycosyltransferase family 4 protein [Vibrio agarivorans]|uniref:Glycosyltransferase family 4 protein n=1 Tax=Vibrio agarivorans TaxID=153622 RepID=A0ABT7XW49_9VIBR|nr:glycosyltransferase family 4 protein [Vibrio agarivorans]MDN2479997.1 glycosyltransferase family 4 protein [Vibrio agarivorans]